MNPQQVILVDHQDQQTGTMEKMEAHRSAHLHRAFSIFIFDGSGKMLLQQRAFSKYHSGGLWTNACCSHPAPGESLQDAVSRRLFEEMGFRTQVDKAFDFIYKAGFPNGLVEFEFDHVFIGQYSGQVLPNREEVSDYCFKSFEEIKSDIMLKPSMYTEWFKIALPKLENHLARVNLAVA